jgi:YtoQ family protein
MTWKVYLSGEIHSDWRQQLLDGASANNLPITFTSAVTDHEASDAAGDLLSGMPLLMLDFVRQKASHT